MAKKRKTGEIFRRLPEAEVDLSSDIRSTILVQAPKGGRLILYLILLFTITAIYWASVSEIDEITRGDGKVIPSRQIQIVQNLEGGIVSEILVGIGDVVEKGQLLLRIDETRFSAAYQENRLSLLALKAKAARLEAEIYGTSLEIPKEVAEENRSIGKREEELFATRKQEHTANLEIIQEQINQRTQELVELKAKLAELTRTNKLIIRELQLTEPLVKQGAVSEVEILRLKRQASELEGELEATRLAIPRAQSKLKEVSGKMEEMKLSFYNEAKTEQNEVYGEIEKLMAASVALEDRLKRTSVRSPVRGTIKQILINTVGGVIQPGMDLIEIVPLEDTLLIEAKIRPSDIAFLHPNQEAVVKFTAYDYTIYGGLKARLEYISADSISDETGQSFYRIQVRTNENHLGTESKPLPIIPGMLASVDILTGKKTIMSYLLKPILRAKNRALRER